MSDLIERVARAIKEATAAVIYIHDAKLVEPTMEVVRKSQARAAIREVAEWLKQDLSGDVWDLRVWRKLEKQLEETK